MKPIKIDGSARLFGRIRLGSGAYVAQGSILRSREDSLSLGNDSWVLENSVLIGTREFPLNVGSKTVFGHKSIAIGAEIGDLCEIGNCTTFLPGSKVGNFCIFGEGTLIPENRVIPDRSVVVGRPGRIIRTLTEDDVRMIKRMRGGDLSLHALEETILNEEERKGGIMGELYEFNGKYPEIAKSAIVFDTAEITGDVVIGEHSVIGSGVKIIGNAHGPVRIGNHVQILENSVLHLLPDNELVIEDHVVIGPGCMIHGTIIGANSLIESGAIVCDYSRIGTNSLVKSGSLVKQRSFFSDGDIIEGYPGKVIGTNEGLLMKPGWAIRSGQ